MYVFVSEEEFVLKMKQFNDWSLTEPATRAIYKTYIEEIGDFNEIATKYFSAIEMSVCEVFEKCKDRFTTEEETYEYLQSNLEIEIEEEVYEIDLDFEDWDYDLNFILIKQ